MAAQEHSAGSHSQTPVSQQPQSQQSHSPVEQVLQLAELQLPELQLAELQAAASLVAGLAEVVQQLAVQLSQQSQEQLPGSHSQTPVAQQPQQSQVAEQAQGAFAENAPATAIVPVATNANKEPITNLIIASTPKEQLKRKR